MLGLNDSYAEQSIPLYQRFIREIYPGNWDWKIGYQQGYGCVGRMGQYI